MPKGVDIRKFESVEELQTSIDQYFDKCHEEKKPYTITGLALALDTTRETLLEYEKNNPNLKDFSDTIKKAKLRCQNYAEERLFDSKQCAGVIFNLKNNYQWKDKTEHDVTTDGKFEISWKE